MKMITKKTIASTLVTVALVATSAFAYAQERTNLYAKKSAVTSAAQAKSISASKLEANGHANTTCEVARKKSEVLWHVACSEKVNSGRYDYQAIYVNLHLTN